MRTRIIGVSRKLFAQYGIRAVTIDTIACEMGISKKTLYEQFASKEDILTECMWQQFDRNGLFDASHGKLIDELSALYARMRRVNISEASRFCRELRRHYHSLYRELLDRMHDYAWACSLKTEAGIDEGYIRKDVGPDVVYAMVRRYLTQFFSDAGFGNLEMRGVLPPEIIPIFARGLCTIKGRAYLDQKLKDVSK